jgi:hypothetical protein
MSPERTSVYDDHFSTVALSRYHFATHHHSVDCRNFLPAYDRTVFGITSTYTVPVFAACSSWLLKR